jgi:hypothetical protein
MTGTTVGLEASPGDVNAGQTPTVTFGYKRAEVALVPTKKESPGAVNGPPDASLSPSSGTTPTNPAAPSGTTPTNPAAPSGTTPTNPAAPSGTTPTNPAASPPQTAAETTRTEQTNGSDAASVLAVFNLALNWFGPAKVEQFLATGFAARTIQGAIVRGFSQADDALSTKFKGLRDNDSGSDCWKAILTWKDRTHPDITENDFIDDPKHTDKRRESVKDPTVKRKCLLK